MNAPLRRLTASAALLVSTAAITSASTVIVWDMGDEWQYPGNEPAAAPTPATHPPAFVPTGISATDIIRGPGIGESRLQYGFSGTGWNSGTLVPGTTNAAPASLATAMANGNYFEVSFTVQPGYELSFEALDYRVRRSATADGRTTESIWQFSFDGFDTIAGNFGQYSMAPGTGAGNGITIPTVDLASVVALQNLAADTTVTMRLYAFDTATPASVTSAANTFGFGRAKNTSGVIIDPNLPEGGPIFTVTVIPEPSTYALVFGGLSLLVIVAARRRRKAA
jgi:hypothetical protein